MTHPSIVDSPDCLEAPLPVRLPRRQPDGAGTKGGSRAGAARCYSRTRHAADYRVENWMGFVNTLDG